MRYVICLLAVAGALALGPASPARADDTQMCSTGEGAQRIEACSRLLATKLDDKTRAIVFYDRAVASAATKDAKSAIADYTDALRLKPDLEPALNNRGVLLRAQGDLAGAVADFSGVIKLDPNRVSAYVNRGIAYGDNHDAANALADFDQVVRLAPSDPQGYVGRCWIGALDGSAPERAINDCNWALHYLPDDPASLGYRALATLRQGDFDAAIADYDRCLEITPGNATFLYGRGIAKLRAGNITGANEDLTNAKQADPHVAQVFAGYGIAP